MPGEFQAAATRWEQLGGDAGVERGNYLCADGALAALRCERIYRIVIAGNISLRIQQPFAVATLALGLGMTGFAQSAPVGADSPLTAPAVVPSSAVSQATPVFAPSPAVRRPRTHEADPSAKRFASHTRRPVGALNLHWATARSRGRADQWNPTTGAGRRSLGRTAV